MKTSKRSEATRENQTELQKATVSTGAEIPMIGGRACHSIPEVALMLGLSPRGLERAIKKRRNKSQKSGAQGSDSHR